MYKKHDQRYFAMLNNAVAVNDTPLEGGSRAEAFAYYQYLLEYPDCPLSANLSKEEETAIKNGIQNLAEGNGLIEKHFKDKFPEDAALEEALTEVITLIDRESETSGTCYLPSGWKADPGHYASLKCRRLANGHFAFSLLNQGGGMEYHRKSPKSGSKDRRFYQSEEYEVDLNSPNGREFIQRLCELMTLSEQEHLEDADWKGSQGIVNEYSALDLYGILKLYGKEHLLNNKLDQKAVTPQRGGTCTMTNTHAVMRDILVDLGADLRKRKRAHFVIKLRSILDGFEAYQQGDCDLNVLEWALREFYVRCNKEYKNVLSSDEMIYCGELENKIRTRLENDKKAIIEEKSKQEPWPDPKGEAPQALDIVLIESEKKASEEKKDKESKSEHIYPPITPESFFKILLLKIKNNELLNLSQQYGFFQSLPHCSGKESDEFWNRVPREQIQMILSTLSRLTSHLHAQYANSPRSLVVSLTIYDITAQLITDKEHTPGLDDVYSELNFFSDPQAYYTVKRIVKNFENRALGKKRVLTNQVAEQGTLRDDTVHYLLHVILDDEHRQRVKRIVEFKGEEDYPLFRSIMKMLDGDFTGRDNNRDLKEALGDTFINLLQIAGSAHGNGNSCTKYMQDEHSPYYRFYYRSSYVNRFYAELKRKKELERAGSTVSKNFPSIQARGQNLSFQDYSENTLYSPEKSSPTKSLSSFNNDKTSNDPYQYELSGSIHPDSTPWKLEAKNRRVFEELNEAFRHLECSPHLQIIRTLSWLKKNPDKIAFKEVRDRIYELLFQYGLMDRALINDNRLTLTQAKDCIASLIKHCREEPIQDPVLISWVGQLANDLKNYARVAGKIYEISLDKVSMPSLQTLFLPLIRNSTNEKMRGLLSIELVKELIHKRPLSLGEAALLVTSRLVAKSAEESLICDEAWAAFYPELMHLIQGRFDEFFTKLSPLLQQYLKIPAETQWKLTDFELISPGSDLYLDLKQGAMQIRGKKLLKDYTERLFKHNEQLFTRFHLSPEKVHFFYDGSTSSSIDQKWTISNYSQDRIHSVYQKIQIEGIQDSFRFNAIEGISDNQFKGNKSPFESDVYFNTHYQYWQSQKDNDLYFIRQDKSAFAYYYRSTGGPILQLKENKQGVWEKSGKILLNLMYPTTAIEKQWAERIGPLFGVMNLRCTAQLNQDHSQVRLERIEHLALGLNFTLDQENHWVLEDDPEYFLAEEKSLEVLHGFPGVVLLQNKKGEMRILVPAFSFKVGDKNNAFNQTDLIDHSQLCDPSFRYFEYTLDENRGLVGQNVESHLYLALLYRSLGDFKRAMEYLQRCKTHQSLSVASLAIALQALKRKISSPLGAAFDIKLNTYLHEHQKKWSLHAKPTVINKKWNQWLVENQFPLYSNSVSAYKSGVSIFPAYCRLSAEEIAHNSLIPIGPNEKQSIPSDKRLEKISSLKDTIFSAATSEYGWESLSSEIINFYVSKIYHESHKSNTWRTFGKRFMNMAGFAYLYEFFAELLGEAISQDSLRVDALRQKLFALLMNDPSPVNHLYHLISILLFASYYPELFSKYSIQKITPNPDDKDEEGWKEVRNRQAKVIRDAGDILIENKALIGDKKLNLVEFQPPPDPVPAQEPLPADFASNPVIFAMNPVKEEAACKYPLKSIADHCFSRQSRPIAQGDFPLDPAFLEAATPLEKRLFEQYQHGHEQNKKNTKTVYTVNPDITLEQARDLLQDQKNKDLHRLSQIKQNLYQIANRSVRREQGESLSKESQAETYNLLLSRASEQHEIITLTDLFSAFLQQKPSLLTEKNPLLIQEDISELFSELSDYALLSSRVAQVNKAVEDVADHQSFNDLEAYEVQLFAETIDKSRSYAVAEYPEFLVYEYMTKRILRKDQVEILTKIIALIEAESSDSSEFHHALLQFAAGGGKTSVLLPILANRFARKGFLPVIFYTDELYKTGLKDLPKNLRESLEQNMEVLERDLDHQWTIFEILKLQEDLTRWKGEGKCLLMKPITWHSLNIARKIARHKGEKLLAARIDSVLDFFKVQSVKLEDESQIISDANQQAIKTYSKPQKIPKDQLELILRFYDHLMGYENGSAEIARLAGIKTKDKHSISPDNLILLQKKLALSMMHEPCFDPCDRELLLDYLTNPDLKRPPWLTNLYIKNINRALADRIVLARAFIQSHLPFILTLQGEKNYGVSMHKGDLTAAPKNEGKEVTRHFGDHTLVVGLTIQMMEQNGLSATQVEQLLLAVRDDHRKERVWNPNLALRTKAEEWLQQFNALGYSIKTIRDLTPECSARLSIDPHFYKHPLVVKKFLRDFALPQIEVPSERETSTPAEMQAGFNRSLSVSATPGPPETYPAVLSRDNCFLEEAFEAQVIDTLLSLKNSAHCIMKATQTPTEFFEALPPEILASLTTLTDRGAVLVDFNAEEVIRSYLGLDAAKKRATTTGVFFSKDETHLQFHGKKRIDIPGTGLVDELKKRKIRPEQFLLFLFIDLSKTTGIDIKRPFKDKAGLTFGKEQTVTETIQAAMRQRQFLDEDAQTVTWIMFESLYREINPKAEPGFFDAREIVYWMIRNEAKQLRSKLISRAYQGIEQEITALAWEAWRKNPESFPDEFKKNLKQFQSVSPVDLYEQESIEDSASVVLNDFRDKLYSRFGFKKDDPRIPDPVLKRIQKIIDETAALIEKLHTPAKVIINNEIQQEMHVEAVQKEEKEITQTLQKNIDRMMDCEFSVEEVSGNTVDVFFNQEVKPIVLPGCEQIQCPTLWFNEKNFRVLSPLNPYVTPPFDQLKPIKMLLVKVNPDNTKEYRACTAIEADYYSLILATKPLSHESPSYAIISSEGDVFSYSNNTSLSACEEWIKEDKTQKMLTYAQFLSGQITNPIIFSQLTKDLGWTKQAYDTLANTLSPMLVSTVRPNISNNTAFYSLCGWGETPVQPDHYASPAEEVPIPEQEEVLQPALSLEKDPGSFEKPPRRPQRGLEEYLFNTPIKKPEVVYKAPEVVVPKQKAPAPVPVVEAVSSSAVDPFAAVKERLDLLAVDFKESNDGAPEGDFDVMIMKLTVMQELQSLKSRIQTDISIEVFDNAIANKRIDSFIDNQLIPYKKTIHEAWLEGDKQRPVFDKLMIEFMNLKGRIYAEHEEDNLDWEIKNSIKNGETIIPKIHKALEKNPKAAKDLNDDFKKYIKTLERDYKPLPPPKAPKKKWW